jgi:hypothetical protein
MSPTTPASPRLRRYLHFDALIEGARQRFQTLPEQRRAPTFPLADTLMAGLALFSLKDPSLLAFQRRARDHNLRTVFGLSALPSDSQLRAILDDVDPAALRPAFRDVFRQVQRGKVLEDYVFLRGRYLLALDGVEYFCSEQVHCPHCLTRQQRNGTVAYHHQLLGAALVHPDFSEVLPLAPEPIQRQDGHQKNDCERNAARRWLQHFRKDHPHLPVIVTEDALSSNAPHVRDLQKARCHFILGVKRGDHAALFRQFEECLLADRVQGVHEQDRQTGASRSWLFVNGLRLNEANREVVVNFVMALEYEADDTAHAWTWVTDLTVTRGNVRQVARGGRTRWRIENETFNTLKNQGYHFAHNYGHGENQLAVVLALLMMLAFLIDQVQQKCNPLFRQAWHQKGPKCALWETVRDLFASFEVSSMREIYEAIAYGYVRPHLQPLCATAPADRPANNTS